MDSLLILGYLIGALVSIGLAINYQLRQSNSIGVRDILVVSIMAISSWLPVLIIAGAWLRHFAVSITTSKEVPQND